MIHMEYYAPAQQQETSSNSKSSKCFPFFKKKPFAFSGTPEFPENLNEIKSKKSLKGTTSPKLVVREKQCWVQKRGASPKHCLNEYTTNKAYQVLGVRVPEVQLYSKKTGQKVELGEETDDKKVVMLSQFIHGITLAKYLSKNPKAKNEIYQKLQENFVSDCLLANWDVIGMNSDNIIVDNEGNPWRIDNGSGLEHRAQGGIKGEAWSKRVKELNDMRDKKINPTAAKVFAGISNEAILRQIDEIVLKKSDLFGVLPTHLHKRVEQRIQSLVHYAQKNPV